MLEKKHHGCELGSTETVKCSKVETKLGQNIAWYDGSTGVKIKSEGRIELSGLSLKITNVHLDDAGTYECRGVSSTRFLTIYVYGKFSDVSLVCHFGIIIVASNHYYNAFCISFVVDAVVEYILRYNFD